MTPDTCSTCGAPLNPGEASNPHDGAAVCTDCAADEHAAHQGPESSADPRDHDDARHDAKRVGEGFGFDKFMDRILVEEHIKTGIKTVADSPQRKRQQARQENPLGRIRFGSNR